MLYTLIAGFRSPLMLVGLNSNILLQAYASRLKYCRFRYVSVQIMAAIWAEQNNR